MAPRLVPLQSLGKVSQGITTSRYVNEKGSVYRIVNVIDLENLYLKDVPGQAQLNDADAQRYRLHENDVIIAIRGALLKSSVVTNALKGSLSNQNTVFFRPESQDIDPLYLAVLLRSPYFQHLPSFKNRQSSTTLPAISVSDLRSLEVPLPDLQTQKQIGQAFLTVEQAKKTILSAIEIRQQLCEVALFRALEV